MITFSEEAKDRAYIVHDWVVYVLIFPHLALGVCITCLGHVFLWRSVTVKLNFLIAVSEWRIYIRNLCKVTVSNIKYCSFFSGIKVMFKVALVLFKHTLGKSEILEECPTLYETMERLRHVPSEIMEEEFISKEVSNAILLNIVIYIHILDWLINILPCK